MLSPRGRVRTRTPGTGRMPITRVGLSLGALVLFVALAVHASTVSIPVTELAAPRPESVVVTYQTQIHPLLVVKCAACHTATPERPLYYYVPIVSYWSQPFIEDHIRKGRVAFDFSNGFPAGRVGAAHEF